MNRRRFPNVFADQSIVCSILQWLIEDCRIIETRSAFSSKILCGESRRFVERNPNQSLQRSAKHALSSREAFVVFWCRPRSLNSVVGHLAKDNDKLLADNLESALESKQRLRRLLSCRHSPNACSLVWLAASRIGCWLDFPNERSLIICFQRIGNACSLARR